MAGVHSFWHEMEYRSPPRAMESAYPSIAAISKAFLQAAAAMRHLESVTARPVCVCCCLPIADDGRVAGATHTLLSLHARAPRPAPYNTCQADAQVTCCGRRRPAARASTSRHSQACTAPSAPTASRCQPRSKQQKARPAP